MIPLLLIAAFYLEFVFCPHTLVKMCQTSNEVRRKLKNYIDGQTCNQKTECSSIGSEEIIGQKIIVLQHRQLQHVQNIQKCSSSIVTLDPYSKTDVNFTSSLCLSMRSLVLDFSNYTSINLAGNTNDDFDDCHVNMVQDHFLNAILTNCKKLRLVNHIDCNNRKKFMVTDMTKIMWTTNNSLANKTLRIVLSRTDEPYVIKINQSDYNGTLVEIIKEASKEFRFNYTIVQPVDNNFGSEVSNGSWNGLIGMLQRNEADIALAAFTVTYARSTVVNFFTPLTSDSYVIVIQKPNTSPATWALMELFSPPVWALYLTSVIVAVVVIWILHKTSVVDGDTVIDSPWHSFWYIFAAQMNQQADRIIAATSGRIFEITWRFASFLLLATYTGGFVAYLTSGRFVLPFTTLDELVDYAGVNNYKICMENGTAFVSTVQHDETGRFKDLRQLIRQNPQKYLNDINNCVKKLINEPNVALITDQTYAKNVQNEYCGNVDLIILRDSFYPNFIAFAGRKRLPGSDLISNKINEILQDGLFQKWNKKYSSESKFCKIFEPSELTTTNTKPLTIVEVAGPFIILCVGIFVSCIVLFVEISSIFSRLKRILCISSIIYVAG